MNNKSQSIFFACFMVIFATTPAFAGDYENEMSTLSDSLGNEIADAGIETVAVTNFRDLEGNVNQLGKFIAEELSVNLVMQDKNITVVDRANLERIMAEHKLTEEGLVRPENAKKLNLAGIDGIVLGSVIPFDGSYRVNVKVIATDTAKYVGATRGTISSNPSLDSLAGVIRDKNNPESVIQTGGGLSSDSSKSIFKLGDITAEVKLVKAFQKQGEIIVHLVFTYDGSRGRSGYRAPGIAVHTPYNAVVSGYDNNGNPYHLKSSTGIPISTMHVMDLTPDQPAGATLVFQYGQGSGQFVPRSQQTNGTWDEDTPPQTFSFNCPLVDGDTKTHSLAVVDFPVK